MSTLPSDDLVVEVCEGIDLTGLTLSRDEGFLLSRAMGRKQTVGELVQVSGLPKEACLKALGGLLKSGALRSVSQVGGDGIDEFEGFLFPPGPMAEEVDLTVDQKKRILFIEAKLDEWNHYGLLGLKRSADASAIKRGYFRASKEFHPDAFFRKNIGTFKPRVDRIFRAMKAAYDVVSNAEKKKEYDLSIVGEYTLEEKRELHRIAEEAAIERRQKQAVDDRKKRQEERLKQKRLRRNPMLDRMKKANDFVGMAEKALQAGNTQEASRHARMALSYSPKDPKLKARAEQIVVDADKSRAELMAKKGIAVATQRPEEESRPFMETMVKLAPENADVLIVAAHMARIVGDLSEAMRYAQRATTHGQTNKKAWETLLEVAEYAKSPALAKRAVERLLEADPKNKTLKDKLKLLKRELG
mgnify:CR=1 FL=1